MAASLVDVTGTIAGGLVQLGAVWRPELCQLVDAIPHAQLPFALFEPATVLA